MTRRFEVKVSVAVVWMLLAGAAMAAPLASAAPPDWGKAGQGQGTGEGAPTKQPGQRPTPPVPGKTPGQGSGTRRILPPAPGPGPAGTAVLKLFWNEQRNDYVTTATDAGAADAQRAGYELVGWVGYVFTEAHAPCTAPLKLYRHPQTQEHATVVSGGSAPSAEESGLLKAGYQVVRIEGHVLNLGATDCARDEAVKKQLTGLAGARPLADLKLFTRGTDYLTSSDSFRGRMDPEHNLRSYRLVTTAGAVYGFPPASPSRTGASAQSSGSPGGQQQLGSALNQVTQPARYGPIAVCSGSQRPWCVARTGIQVRAGSRVDLVTTGKVDFGGRVLGAGAPVLDADGDHWQTPQDYPAPGLRKNSLIARVGSKYYQGGTQRSFTPDEDGELILLPNDNNLSDNGGVPDPATGKAGWQVTVTITPPPGR